MAATSIPRASSIFPRCLVRRWAARLRVVVPVAGLLLLTACGAGRSAGPAAERVAGLLAEAERTLGAEDYAAALALTDSAARVAPELAAAHFMHGRVLLELLRLDDAAAAFERTLALDPDFEGARFQLGHALLQKGRYEEALAHYERERERLAAADVEKPVLASVHLQLGRTHELMGDVERARAAFREALVLDSLNAQAHNWLSDVEEQAGAYDEAVSHAARACELDPGNVDYLYDLGRLLNQIGEPALAVELLTRVVHHRPWDGGAHYNLGQALLRSGKEEAAQHFLAQSDSLQQLNADVERARVATHIQPDRAENWVRLARILLRLRRFDEARQVLATAQSLRPRDLQIQNDLANVALAQGDTTAAIRRYRSILSQDSTLSDVWLNLGVVYALSGAEDQARAAWGRTLELAPGHPEARSYLARLDGP